MSANFFWWPCMYCGGGRPVNGCAMRYPANKFSHSPGLSRLTASLTPHNSGTVGMSCLSTFFTISSASAAGIAHERTYVGATCVTRTSAPSLSLALMDSGSSRIVESSPVLASYASSRPIAKCGASSGGPRSTNEATRVPRKYLSMRAFFYQITLSCRYLSFTLLLERALGAGLLGPPRLTLRRRHLHAIL